MQRYQTVVGHMHKISQFQSRRRYVFGSTVKFDFTWKCSGQCYERLYRVSHGASTICFKAHRAAGEERRRRLAISLETLSRKADKRADVVANGGVAALTKLSRSTESKTRSSCAQASVMYHDMCRDMNTATQSQKNSDVHVLTPRTDWFTLTFLRYEIVIFCGSELRRGNMKLM